MDGTSVCSSSVVPPAFNALGNPHHGTCFVRDIHVRFLAEGQ